MAMRFSATRRCISVNITAPADQVVATSGVCERAEQAEQRRCMHCVSGPMRDFMIAMSADYLVKSGHDRRRQGQFVLPPVIRGRRDARRWRSLSDALKSYDRRIGAYPFTELDVVATPTTAGGIEYPGLIVVAEGLSEKNPDAYEGATAHEVAHQWWYSLVGNDQVDEPWLDEALTQFTSGLVLSRCLWPAGSCKAMSAAWKTVTSG